MKIAIVTTYPPSKGTLNEYAYHFVDALASKSEVQEIFLLVDECTSCKETIHFQGDQNKRVSILPSWRFNALDNTMRIVKTVRSIRPDVVLFNIQFTSFGDRKLPATLGLLSPALVKLLGVPTMVLLHNIMETVDLKSAGFSNNLFMQALIQMAGTLVTRILLAADFVATTIPQYVEILQGKYKAENVILIPHGTFEYEEETKFSNELPLGPLQIMTFGKFGTYKKIETLIEAFDILIDSERQEELKLVVAGTSNPNVAGYIENLADQYSNRPDINFTGYVPEEDVPVIFQEAAVVVFPYTSTTGSSGVLHQAGSYGKAVVLPKIGDFIDLISEEGYTGETFEPENAKSLADAIAKVIYDPEKRTELGMQNFLASKGLPMNEIVDWYLIHMQTLLQTNRKPQQIVLAETF